MSKRGEKAYYVYILANKPRGTLYIGVTNDLVRRVYEHRNDFVPGFSRTYHTHSLVYFEQTGSIESALNREKRLKHWLRQWKIGLIEQANPAWNDLWEEIIQ